MLRKESPFLSTFETRKNQIITLNEIQVWFVAADPDAHLDVVAVDSRVYQNNMIAANYTGMNNMVSCLQMCMYAVPLCV